RVEGERGREEPEHHGAGERRDRDGGEERDWGRPLTPGRDAQPRQQGLDPAGLLGGRAVEQADGQGERGEQQQRESQARQHRAEVPARLDRGRERRGERDGGQLARVLPLPGGGRGRRRRGWGDRRPRLLGGRGGRRGEGAGPVEAAGVLAVDRVPDAGQHRGPDGGPGPRVRHRRLPRRAGRRRGGGGDDGRVLVGLLIGRRGGVLVRRLLLVARLAGVRLLLFVLVLFVLVLFVLVLFVLVLFVLVLFVLVLFVLVLVVVFVVEAGEVGEVRELRVEQVAQRALARLLGAGTVGQQGLD